MNTNEELKTRQRMKVLHLTLKKRWFDMIEAGIKKEEYREIKPFWNQRIYGRKGIASPKFIPIHFDAVQFYNGWACSTKYPNFQIQCNSIDICEGKPEWGAEPGKKYFVIKLGEKLKG